MSTSWECIALDGERVPHGENFVPGPDYCTACKCEKGEAKFCRAALCQPPQDCRSFRVGESCCDFICLDDILPTRNNNGGGVQADTGLRMVASAITAILSLALLLFLIHRLRQRKLRTASQHLEFEDQFDAAGEGLPDNCRSNSCCRNAMYLSGNDHVDFFLDGYTPPYSPWKPPSYYYPHREAPPPYSEVVANDRALARAEGALPSLSPLMVELSSAIANQESHAARRISVSLRNSVVVSEALSQIGTNCHLHELAGASQPELSSNSALLSDQLYENLTYSEQRESLRTTYVPPPVGSPLNELNKGIDESSACGTELNADLDNGHNYADESECQNDSTHNQEKCNVCTAASQQLEESDARKIQASVRYRQRAITSPSQEEGHSSVADEFQQLRLQLDISDSSTTTEGPSQVLGSISSSGSSEDVPSIRSNTDINC